jgi:hypothetical protein
MGDEPMAVISFAESAKRAVRLEHLWEYAAEEGNPGNEKHVTDIEVRLASCRLKNGVMLVDTPGVGSLALSGGAEALAYLPRCDLGVVLVDAASAINEEDLALLRALYGAGIPAMVLLSKADLLAPRDRDRMSRYIREQVHRNLELDLLVHPVSTVGPDESLLTRWFEDELATLLKQHGTLVAESLRRRIAHLRESVISTLETLLARRRGMITETASKIDTGAAERLLDGADEAIRQARDRIVNWLDDSTGFAENIPPQVARGVFASLASGLPNDYARIVEEALKKRGMAAYEVVTSLQDTLTTTVDSLRRVSPLADADVTSLRDYHGAGLPPPNFDLARDGSVVQPPWWTVMASPLRVRAVERAVWRRFGSEITDAVRSHDGQLRSWLRTNVARLVELYDAQAAAFREQIRRLSAESVRDGEMGGHAELEADLRELGMVRFRSDSSEGRS